MKLKFGDIVQVTWEDATSCGGWNPGYSKGVLVRSVGNFVSQDKKGICLAKGVAENDDEIVLGPCFIPKGMIRKIRRLK